MIITCTACSTRFNLDESRLKPKGSKVRCSLCKQIFTAFPPAPDPILNPEENIQPDLPKEPGMADFGADDFSFEGTDFEIDDQEEGPKSGLEMESSQGGDAADIEISFDSTTDSLEFEEALDFDGKDLTFDEGDLTFDGEDITFDEAPSEISDPADPDEFEFMEIEGSDPEISGTEDDSETSLFFEEDLDADLVFEETGSDTGPSPTLEGETLKFEAAEPETSEDHGADDHFSAYDQVLYKDMDLEEKAPDLETEPPENDLLLEEKESPKESQAPEIKEEPTPDRPWESPLIINSDLEADQPDQDTPPRRKKKPALGAPVIILLLLFLTVAGAYIASLVLGYQVPYLSEVKIPFIEQYLKKEVPPKIEPKPIPNQESVNGRFVSNDTAGELFVITGRIENLAAIPYGYIQVKGILITKGKVETTVQTAFCGNIIADEVLKTGNISDIHKQLTLKQGAHDSNVSIKPGASVPFMLVFSNLPDNLENFTVEVIGFEKEEAGK